VGEPLPPLLNVPQPVTDLSAVQRGQKIIVHFTLPRLTTEGHVMKQRLEWDLRMGEPGKGEFHLEEWAARAQSPTGGKIEKSSVTYDIPAAPWFGKDVVLNVRVANAKRHSDWAKPVILSVLKPPATPSDVKAENVTDGVRLSWKGSGPSYRVYRKTEADPDFTVAANTEAGEYLDKTTEYGKPVQYILQAIIKTGTGEVESELSKPYTHTPVDLFPPAVPGGLTAVPTPASIELTWDRDTEPDLAGYRIYRAAPGAGFEKIAETVENPSYSDKQVKSGEKYRYQVSAFDKSGNESKRSNEIEVAVP